MPWLLILHWEDSSVTYSNWIDGLVGSNEPFENTCFTYNLVMIDPLILAVASKYLREAVDMLHILSTCRGLCGEIILGGGIASPLLSLWAISAIRGFCFLLLTFFFRKLMCNSFFLIFADIRGLTQRLRVRIPLSYELFFLLALS